MIRKTPRDDGTFDWFIAFEGWEWQFTATDVERVLDALEAASNKAKREAMAASEYALQAYGVLQYVRASQEARRSMTCYEILSVVQTEDGSHTKIWKFRGPDMLSAARDAWDRAEGAWIREVRIVLDEP